MLVRWQRRYGMAEALAFFAEGHPETAGSKRPVAGMRKDGSIYARAIEGNDSESQARKKAWRQIVQLAAQQAMRQQGWRLETGPVTLLAVFFRRHSAKHYGTGRNARVLKPNAPLWSVEAPDALKLARAVEDALSGVAYKDDAQVILGTQAKVYVDRFSGREGAGIYLVSGEPRVPVELLARMMEYETAYNSLVGIG